MKKKQFCMVLVSILTISFTNITSFGTTTSIESPNSNNFVLTNEDYSKEVSIIEEGADSLGFDSYYNEHNNKLLLTDKTEYLLYDFVTGKITFDDGQPNILSLSAFKQSSLNNIFDIELVSNASYKTYKISYKQLVNITGESTTYIGGAITVLGWLGITVSNPVSGVASIAGVIAAASSHVLSNNHGITIKIKTVRHYRTRLGKRRCYKTTHEVVGVGTY